MQRVSDPRPIRLVLGVPPLELAAVYCEHADFVARTVRQFGIPEAQTEDIVHDVFLVVHRRLPDYDGSAPIKSWLYGITRRVVMHHQRGFSRAQRRLEHIPDPAPAPDPDEHVAKVQAVQVVRSFLGELDQDKRAVFALIEIEEMPAPEVARVLGVGLNTVYSRLRAARQRFERSIERWRSTREERARGRA